MISKGLVLSIRLYQRCVSPFFPPSCRFVPSCSEYAAEAISRRGALVGSWLALRRLLRCWPFLRGGLDPVPEVGVLRSGAAKPATDSGCTSEAATAQPGLPRFLRQIGDGRDAG